MTEESIGNNAIFLYHVTQRLRDSYSRIGIDALKACSNPMSLGLCRWYCAQTRGTQRPDVSRYAISVSDGFLYICFRSLFGYLGVALKTIYDHLSVWMS